MEKRRFKLPQILFVIVIASFVIFGRDAISQSAWRSAGLRASAFGPLGSIEVPSSARDDETI